MTKPATKKKPPVKSTAAVEEVRVEASFKAAMKEVGGSQFEIWNQGLFSVEGSKLTPRLSHPESLDTGRVTLG